MNRTEKAVIQRDRTLAYPIDRVDQVAKAWAKPFPYPD